MKTMMIALTTLLTGCVFLSQAPASVEPRPDHLAADVELNRFMSATTATSHLQLNWCVEYTYYAKKNGVVSIVFSGKDGPYDRTEAQSRVDQLNAKEKVEKGVRYFYKARVVPR